MSQSQKQPESLVSRHDIEKRFHDAKASSGHGSGHGDFYGAGGLDQVWHAYLEAAGDISGKTILDFGCGEGWSTLEYAKRGAVVCSFDISPESVRNLVRNAFARGVSDRIHPAVMAAESLGFTSHTFDLVLGVAILHHIEVCHVGQEIARVLKPGGRALFMEPLAHNVFLRIFRWLTPQRRTPTEQPLTVQQIQEFCRPFGRCRIRGYALLSIFPQGLFWLTGSRGLMRWSLRLAETADRWLLRMFPFLYRYCWSAIIEVQK